MSRVKETISSLCDIVFWSILKIMSVLLITITAFLSFYTISQIDAIANNLNMFLSRYDTSVLPIGAFISMIVGIYIGFFGNNSQRSFS